MKKKININLTQREYEKLKQVMRLRDLASQVSHLRSDEDNQTIAQLCNSLQMFHALENSEAMDFLAKRIETKSLTEGQILDDYQYYYVVLLGQIGVFEQQRVNLHKQGSGFSVGQYSVSTTLRADEDTDLLQVKKSLYDYLLQQSQETRVSHVMQFMRSLKVFEKMSSKNLLELSKQVTIKKIEANTLVIRQGDYPGNFFIVLSGELKVLRRMVQKTQSSPKQEVVFDLSTNTVCNLKDFVKRTPNPLEGQTVPIDDVKLFEVADLQRGDSCCLKALTENSPIQYSVVSNMSSQLLTFDRLVILKYENELKIPPEEYQYVKDDEIITQISKDNEWSKFKKIQCQQVMKEKQYRNKRFEGLLRTDYNLNFKRNVDYVRDEQIQKRQFMHKSLPPIRPNKFKV